MKLQLPDKDIVNQVISKYMGTQEPEYQHTRRFDCFGVPILEGSIINADGYNSDLVERDFHCVEFYKGQFGSDIYSDFEPLSRYKTIQVVGHVEDYRGLECTGNFGEVLKDPIVPNYYSSYELIIPVMMKINQEYPGSNDGVFILKDSIVVVIERTIVIGATKSTTPLGTLLMLADFEYDIRACMPIACYHYIILGIPQ